MITGAARGIGEAIATRFSRDGYRVILVDKDEEAGRATAGQMEHAIFLPADIADEQQVRDLFRQCLDQYGKVDVLVNNAAIIRDHMIHKMTLEEFESVVDINLTGTWLMCREAAAIMREARQGRIINISSRGWLGNLGQTNYAASKAGVIGLTRVLGLELGRYNVLVNAVAPGAIQTPMTDSMPEDDRQKLIEAQPTKSMGQPEDVAHAVAFLADPETQFITGQTLYVDGGKSIGAGV